MLLKLKKRKYFALLGILVLVFMIAGIFTVSKYDKYKGLITIKNANTKLLGDVTIPTKGTDKVTYQVKYTLDTITGLTKRDVIIRGTLNSEYARFKPITDTNITSNVSNDGKTIEVTVRDVPLGEEQALNLNINVVNAPNNEEIKPVIEVKEATGEYTKLETDTILVQTNSIEGIVYDDNNEEVPNIELSLYKDGNEVKRTYTNKNGKFVYSDLETGNYNVRVEEDIYDLYGDSSSSESNDNLILRIKEVDKFNIETHKYITNLKLIIDGKEENYSYDDVEKVVKSIKKFNNISGEIEYKIVVKNNSNKQTMIKEVIDEVEDGLSFATSKNPGWVLDDNKVRYTPLEGVILNGFEKREAKITLDIKNTKELGTYINKFTTKGEINERVIFILNGEEIRNITVQEGSKITKPSLDKEVTWYTDRNLTNEYDFSNGVTKDLILYGETEEIKYNVTFKDGDTVISVDQTNHGKIVKPTDPEKDGYTFKCWTLNDTCFDFDDTIEADIVLSSSYELKNFEITYDGLTEEEIAALGNPTSYNIETNTFTLNNPGKRKDSDGNNLEDFVGWDDGEGNISRDVEITIGSTNDRTYTAVWRENQDDYNITYNLNGGSYDGEGNPNTYKRSTETFTLNPPSKAGYDFLGWTGSNGDIPELTVTITKGSAGVKNYTANYQAITYTINYSGLTEEEIATLGNPTTYTIESNPITLNNPEREGYTFTGWSLDDSSEKVMTVVIDTGSMDNRTYTPNFEINSYILTVNPNGGTYNGSSDPVPIPNDYGTIITLDTPVKEGYTFSNWALTGKGSLVENVYTYADGNGEVTANYTVNTYEITYEGLTDEEKASLQLPSSYTVEDEITLTNPSDRLDSDGDVIERFTGWTIDGSTSIVGTIPRGSTENKTITATFTHVDPDTYTITYNLNGGSVSTENPTSYTKKTATFTLNNPTKEGYDFAGWTGTGLTEPTITVTIPRLSTGDREYTATYNTITYSIGYDLNGGTATGNPTTYNIENDSITLVNPTKEGYDFTGWTGTGLTEPTVNVTIPSGSTENRSYTANYEKITYSISYDLNGGTATGNPTTYDVESDSITLVNPTKEGYDFTGWTGTGLSEPTVNVTIPTGSTENRNYTANYSTITYTISYSGLTPEEITALGNPTSFTIETTTFTLTNPENRKDSLGNNSEDFVGWDDGEGNVSTNVTIDLGSTNNKTYTAIWKTNEDAYSITYNLNEGHLPEGLSNPSGYTRLTNTFTLNNPEREGYTFTGWTGPGLSEPTLEVTIPYGSAGDRTYTANYSINQSTLSINPNGGKYNNKTTISTYTEDYGTVLVIEPSEREGYTFDSYTLTGGGSYSNNSYTFGATDGTLTASYTPITYNLTYSGLTDEEISSLGNPTTYTTETASFTLQNPSNRKDSNNNPSEDFVGWDDGEGNVSLIVTINPGEMGDKTYTAVWNENQNSYSITYNLNDGTYAGDGNPNTYKRSTETFTLNPPSKVGYTFIGWTGSNGETPELTVTIPKGSAGNKTFTANYQTNNYTINYGGLTPEEETTLDNPTSFTIESDPFTVTNPTQRIGSDGYPTEDFVGWDDGEGNIVDTLVIDPTDIGDKIYTAVWEDNVDNYHITYNLNGGSVSTDNPETYNRKTETFTLNNPTKNGYTFTGWSGTGIEGTSMSVTVTKGSAGPRTYTANYVISNYTISYAGLSQEELTTLNNPTIYNENTATFTLNNPTRTGYTFTGWSGTDIDLKTYTVTYDYQDGRDSTTATYSETSTPNGWLVNDYHYDDNAVLTLTEDIIITRDNLFGENAITLPTPTRENYVFDYWNSKPDGSGIIYDNDSINNLNGDTRVYAIWHPEKVNITFEENEGSAVTDLSIDYNTAIGDLPTTTRTNYIFEGWFTSEDYDVKVSSTTKFNKDTTLYAKWKLDPFPYVYGPYTDSLVFDGSNYINTNVMLYNNDNWEADYEIGFTIESYDPNNQPHTQSVFMNTKYENKNLSYPGLTVRKSSGDIEITSTINGNKTNPAPKVSNYTLPLTIKIYRINKVVYYSVNDGQRIELQSMANFNQQFELPVYFGAGDNGSGGTQRYIRATMSNMYIKMGTHPENPNNTNNSNSDVFTIADLVGNTAADVQNNVTHTFNGANTPRPNGSLNTGISGSGVVNVIDPDGIITIHEVGEEYNLGVNDTPINGKRMTVTVPTGSTGNRVYVAHFDPTKYKVTYMDGEDKFYEEEVLYNRKATGTIDVPTKAHNVFIGWYLNDSPFDLNNTPITGDITLTSRYEEVAAPYITYSPNTWTNDKTTVTISSDHDDYTYMYKIGDGNYQEYTGPFDISENTTVYAYSVKNTIASLETSVSIDNLDKIDPVIIDADLGDVTQVNAELNLSIQDDQSGLDKFKVYVDNVLVYESLSYTTDLTEQKDETYLIGNLEAEHTYTIKIEVLDTVGNVSVEELTVTTANRTPVARTLTFDGTEIETYPTLQDALDSDTCVSKCYIEMLDNVRENNTILSSQDITIDLNGKQINGGNTYSFINNGRLTILDRNETNVGRVLSSTVAIKNNEFLQIGENEDPLSVSDTRPIIEGNTKGVETDGTLNYFDGHIIGDTPIYGLVSETPYSYNVTITETQSGKPESALVIMANAVARRNTTYYSEVQTGIDESTNGELEEVDYTRPLIEQLRSNDFYRFVYDEQTHSVVNNNPYESSRDTIAHSYIKLDLTNYTDSQMLTINAELSGAGRNYDVGYVTISDSIDTPAYNDANGRLIYLSHNTESKDYYTFLQKGKIYYIHICYMNGVSDNTADVFRINKISLGNFNQVEFSNLSEIYMYNDADYYFEKDENGYYVSNNTGIPSSSAHSYFVVDLTNVNEDKYIDIGAKISSKNYDYGYIYVTNSPTKPTSGSYQLRLNGELDEKEYRIKLNKNEINFVHICYYKGTSESTAEDKFIITSIRPLISEDALITDGNVVNNGDYYFEKQEDGSYRSNNQDIDNSVANSFIKFDLTNKPNMTLLINVTMSSAYNDFGYITVTNTDSAPAHDTSTGRVYYSYGSGTKNITVSLNSNTINYLHFGYRKDSSGRSYNDCFTINSITVIDEETGTIMYSSDYTSTVTDNYSDTELIPVLNEEPETVQLLRDVTLSNPLNIVNTRNVVLDLNGKTLTTSANDYVIKNNGSLKIIDSEYQGRGNINTAYKTEQSRMFEEAKQQYLADLAEYNEYAGLCDGCSPSEQYNLDKLLDANFDYTGESVEYIVPFDGDYKIQVWGAQGGYRSNSTYGGKGGYSEGTISLTKDEVLYVYVGGSGNTGGASGGFNGGGSRNSYPGGGGATDVRIEGNSLYNRIIVAGGGGSDGSPYKPGKAGGGLEGKSATESYGSGGTGGTQISPGTNASFGIGGNGISQSGGHAGAGGGGWYGGGGSTPDGSSDDDRGGGGGSGFVYDGTNTVPQEYAVTSHVLTNTKTLDGTSNEIPTYDGTSTMTGNEGDGYAIISNLSLTDEEIEELYNNLPKKYNITSRPIFKDYLDGIDFDSSIDIDNIDISSTVDYNNEVDDTVYGTISNTNNSVILNEEGAYLNVESGNVILNKSGEFSGINNCGLLTLGEGAYIKTLQTDNIAIHNTLTGDILDGSGTILSSGNKNYGILNDSLRDDYINGYKISNSYRWYYSTPSYDFYNRGDIDLVLDNITTSENGIAITHDSPKTLTINNSYLNIAKGYSFDNQYYGSNKVIFNNCNITNAVFNSSETTLEINNSRIYYIVDTEGNYIDNSGLMNINNSTIVYSNPNNSSCNRNCSAIRNFGTLNITGGEFNGDNSIKNATVYAISNTDNSILNVFGDLSIDEIYKYGISNYGILTLGEKDNYTSANYPLISGSYAAIYNSFGSEFNYYDGKLVGPVNKALLGIISDIPVEFDVDAQETGEKEIITLKSYDSIDYVAQIGDDKFTSIQNAINSIEDSGQKTEITLLKDIHTAKNIIIPHNKNVAINQNGYLIKGYNDITFTNNGTFEIKDDSDSPVIEDVAFGYFIINNNDCEINNLKLFARLDNTLLINDSSSNMNISNSEIRSHNELNYSNDIVDNSGTLSFANSKLYSDGAYQLNLLSNNENAIAYFNNTELKHYGYQAAVDNFGRVEMINCKGNLSGALNSSQSIILNETADSSALVNGGIFGDTNKNGHIVENNGTFELTGNLNNNLEQSTITSNSGIIYIHDTNVSNSQRFSVNLTGDSVLNFQDSTINSNSGTVLSVADNSITNIISGNIISNGRVIYSSNNATINILSANIDSSLSNSSEAIYLNSNSVLNIGTSDAIVDKTNPTITGKSYGLYNNSTTSTVNFYDGIITGQTAIYGNVTSIEPGYEIILEIEDNIEHKYLDKLPIIKNIDKNNTEYYSIQDAIDDATDGDRLELLREYTTSSTAPTITNNKIITIDLKGFKINQNNEDLFTNNGTLTIKSSVDGGIVESIASNTFVNYGILNIENGLYRQTLSNDIFTNNENAIINITGSELYTTNKRIIYNSGIINMDDVKISTTQSMDYYTCLITNNTNAEINASNVEMNLKGFYYTSQAAVINDGRFILDNSKIDLDHWCSGGYCYSSTFLINNLSGYVKVNGGIFGKNVYAGNLISNKGIAEITGNIDHSLGSIVSSTSGTVNVYDANISQSTNTPISRPIIAISGDTLLNFENSSANNRVQYTLSCSGSSISNVNSGHILTTYSSGYGISVSENAVVNIGTPDGIVNNTNLSITGKTYGLYNNSTTSTVNFYDGIISGQTAIYGNITNIESGYEIILESEDNIEHKYLDLLPLIKNIDKSNTEYYSIQDAIDNANDGDRLELLREYTTSSMTQTVTNNKTITIDLKGNKISQSNEALFTNNGVLTIKTSIDGGIIETTASNIFINNGILNIEGGKYYQSAASDILTNSIGATANINDAELYSKYTRIINNFGTININYSKVYSIEQTSYQTNLILNNDGATLICNEIEIVHKGYDQSGTIKNYGTFEINDSKVDLKGYSRPGILSYNLFLENEQNGHVKIKGGTFGETDANGILFKNKGFVDITGEINTMLPLNNATSGIVNIKDATINGDQSFMNVSGTAILNFENSILNTRRTALIGGDNSIINIISGFIKKNETTNDSDTAIISISGNSTLNIGTPGGIPSTTDPVIQGENYAISNTNTGKVYFYDGVVKGKVSPFNGPVTDYEPGYKEERNTATDPDTGVTTINSTLTIVGTDTMKLSVGNINFETLQSAVNYAVANSISRIDLHKDLDLPSNVVKPDGIEVNVYLNGHTINNNGYTIGTGINLIGANSGNGLGANVFGSNKNSENIVIYQFDDGSELDTNMVYRLYELDNGNYEIVNINENRVGNYDIGSETDELHTTNGKIYINNVPEGTYKLTAADGREINFEITDSGVSSNININNKVIINRIVETVATVILTIQTGIERHYYLILIIPIILIIATLVIIGKNRKREI